MESRKMALMNLFAGQQRRCRHREQTRGHIGRGKRWDDQRIALKHIHQGICCVTQGTQTWCSVTTQRGRKGWEVGRRFRRKRTYTCLWLIHVDVRQKPSQYCTVIILQLKIEQNLKQENILSHSIACLFVHFLCFAKAFKFDQVFYFCLCFCFLGRLI